MFVVTGPSGNVGAEVARLTAGRTDLPYRIAAHHPDGIRARLGPETRVVPFDYDDRATWPAVLDGVTTLFLLFPLPHPRTVGTRMKPFIDAAVAAGVGHIVYVSVPGADRQKVVPHHQVEAHIKASGVPYTILRCSFFMQNLCRRLSTHGVDVVERDELFIPAGRGRTTFIDARDVADVVLKIAADPAAYRNREYVLTGAERLDFFEVAEIFSAVMGRPIRYTKPSLPRFWWRLWRRGVAWDAVLFMTIVYTLTRTGKNEPMTDELAALLGRPPRTMREFVRDYLPRWEKRDWT
ncbi:NmrA family NAD(P)-binding protein [Actinocorallia sp. A-T 12471]|uniref:NmrA family NAD(P)-binding protein n=1 Tax=Actinocorallia sp. A-T 12471 TaxID=3089813 RepID=UPI0029CF4D57|nr:NmrA family NAD(P)-binding protein [Actinocorallia sp. A-T 12471]MDX6742388.1 NmrA family NAD(P)-binding protein [Actinocorallia sp. A-T 12471]